MKIAKIALIFISFASLISGCEKIPFDHRNKYLDNWSFDVANSREWYTTSRGFFDTTTVTKYHGEIKRGSTNDAIQFATTYGYSVEFSIDKDGQIIPVNDHGADYSEYGGFEGKSIFEYHYYHRWGGTPHKFVATDIHGERE
jgi:hypothetical protein